MTYSKLGFKHYVFLGLTAFVVWIAAFFTQHKLVGTPPTTKMASETKDDYIEALKSDAMQASTDVAKWQAVVGAIQTRLETTQNPDPSLILDLIDALSIVVKLAPNDKDALLMLAEISFEQQAFEKGIDLYEKYLAIEPKDYKARANYASALTFSGRYDKAIGELNGILKEDPKNFQATAYLSIAYAQRGDKKNAIALGEKALKLSPDDEGRARFGKYLESIRGGTESPKASTPSKEVVDSPVGKVVKFVSENPIAGTKLVSHSVQRETLSLTFEDFPMDMMPPVAKEKFLGGVKKKASETQGLWIKRILFIDKKTGKEMAKVEIGK